MKRFLSSPSSSSSFSSSNSVKLSTERTGMQDHDYFMFECIEKNAVFPNDMCRQVSFLFELKYGRFVVCHCIYFGWVGMTVKMRDVIRINNHLRVCFS